MARDLYGIYSLLGDLMFRSRQFHSSTGRVQFYVVEVFALCVLIVVCLTICLWVLSVYIGCLGIIFMEFKNFGILSHS